MVADMSNRAPSGRFFPTEAWTRTYANTLVAEGFDPGYVAHRLGLPKPGSRRAAA